MKFLLLALTVVGAYSLYTSLFTNAYVLISTLVAGGMALIWKTRGFANRMVKLMWIGFVLWGLAQVFQNRLLG